MATWTRYLLRLSSLPGRLPPGWIHDKGVTPLDELRQTAIDLGVQLLACKMSMDVMEIGREDLIGEVSDVVGVATYIKHAAESEITLFI